MLFYKLEGTLKKENMKKESDAREALRQRSRQLRRKSEEFNAQLENKAFYFISDFSEETVVAGVIVCDPENREKWDGKFFRALSLPTEKLRSSEITFSSLRTLLRSAERDDYIDRLDAVMERFALDPIEGRFHRELDFGEKLLVDSLPKETLFQTAEKHLAAETLIPELSRIFAGKKNARAHGHPVHYMIQTDDPIARRALSQTLLQALYQNARLKSKRYCFIDFFPGQGTSRFVYDALYKSCIGGAILVRFMGNDDSAESAYANSEFETVQMLSETAAYYRNQVLTVFCLPRECSRIKQLFHEQLGSLGMIELTEDAVGGERAQAYLRLLAKENHIRPDKKLREKVEPGKTYLAAELHRLFDMWYDRKLKTTVYPQYRETVAAEKVALAAPPKGSAYDELEALIGLDTAKQVICKALDYYKLQRMCKSRGIGQDRPAMHMIFTGNPGTAKTTVARLFARIMKENDILSRGQLIEVGRADLVAKYVGWTAKTVQNKFKAASGGVLFIDEAYALVEERGGLYGDEAINTIVQEMENHREDVVVIFAGYPDKMEEFLQRNPGLRSRIAFHIPFADYDTDELCRIARLMGKRKGVLLSDGAVDRLSHIFAEARATADFGNGRYVRNVLEHAKMRQASRILRSDFDTVTDAALMTIEAEDIELPEAGHGMQKRPIGFAC